MRHHLQALAHEGPVQAVERHHIAHRAKRDQIKPLNKVRLADARLLEPAGCPQPPVQSHHQQKGDPDRGQMTAIGLFVLPVRVHHGGGHGKTGFSGMVIDHDHLEALLRRIFQRLESGDSAVHCDDNRDPFGFQLAQSCRVRPVTL